MKFIVFKINNLIKYPSKSAFQYRNNIAHPKKVKDIKFKPNYLYEHEHEWNYENRLAYHINKWFILFLLFLLKTWLKKSFKSKEEWYQYLDDLFL